MNATVATSTRERVFRRSFPPRTSSAHLLRTALGEYLACIEVDGDAAASLLLCADEALINAVAHAPLTPVLVGAWVREERLILEVSDEGPGFEVAVARLEELPDLDADHGRGLFLIHQLMDDVEVRSGSTGTVVRMWKRTRAG
jgi:anti-sigma regulatory factor (Ser/Thr protein kinase)